MAKKSIGAALGGEPFVQVVLYVPSADRDGRPRSDQDEWKEKALRFFAKTFGKGATAMPRADGVWLNPQTDQLVRESPILVYCYVTEKQLADSNLLRELRQFCYEMGKAMHQGEVLLVVGDRMVFIPTF